MIGVKYWEIIADNLKKAGWSLGYVSAVDSEGRTIWIVKAHRAFNSISGPSQPAAPRVSEGVPF